MTSNFDRTRKEIHAKETYRHFPYGAQMTGMSFHTYPKSSMEDFPYLPHIPCAALTVYFLCMGLCTKKHDHIVMPAF